MVEGAFTIKFVLLLMPSSLNTERSHMWPGQAGGILWSLCKGSTEDTTLPLKNVGKFRHVFLLKMLSPKMSL